MDAYEHYPNNSDDDDDLDIGEPDAKEIERPFKKNARELL